MPEPQTLREKKAIEALQRHNEKERLKHRAYVVHSLAYARMYLDGVMLPFKILKDIEKEILEGTFNEVPPNPYYPAPGLPESIQPPTIDFSDIEIIPIQENGYPDFSRASPEYKKAFDEYKDKVNSKKMPPDKWAYYYARFLMGYDFSQFSYFDILGRQPSNEHEKNVAEHLRKLYTETQKDCIEHPEKYFLEDNPIRE